MWDTNARTIMSSRGAEKEGFIDRHQLWPFYRRRRYCDETMEQIGPNGS